MRIWRKEYDIKDIVKRLVVPNSYSSEAYINYLRSKGIKIGEKCVFYGPNSTKVDVQRPHMLRIGNHVRITAQVTILCHDYSRSVLCDMDGFGNVGEARETVIGNNVFIGHRALILMGAHIGNNSIVGAGSVVTGKVFPDGSVIAGNPARVVCTIQEMYNKRKAEEKSAAKLYANRWKQIHGDWPKVNDMTDAFSWMYLPHTEDTLDTFTELFGTGTIDTEVFKKNFLSSKPEWPSFDEFISECIEEEKM